MKLSRLISHRNSMAHGVTHDEELSKEKIVSENDVSFLLSAQWEDFITLKNAKDSIECVSEIINKLNSSAGLGDWAFTSGTEVADVEIVAPNKGQQPTVKSVT